jgi:hypothetical protein
LSDIVNFLRSLEFWKNTMNQMMQLKMHGFWAILCVCHEIVTNCQLGTLFLQLGDCRRPHGPPSGSTRYPSTRPATFQWHVGSTPVPLRAPCRRKQAIGPT